jgi:hypothetical protein
MANVNTTSGRFQGGLSLILPVILPGQFLDGGIRQMYNNGGKKLRQALSKLSGA